MKHFIFIAACLFTLLLSIGCSTKTTTLVPASEIEIGYIEDNVAVIYPKKFDTNYLSQAVSTAIIELHKKDKVVTSIDFLTSSNATSYNGVKIIYIVYTDNPNTDVK